MVWVPPPPRAQGSRVKNSNILMFLHQLLALQSALFFPSLLSVLLSASPLSLLFTRLRYDTTTDPPDMEPLNRSGVRKLPLNSTLVPVVPITGLYVALCHPYSNIVTPEEFVAEVQKRGRKTTEHGYETAD